MGVRKQSEQNIRKLTKMGGRSLGLTLPIELVAELKWKEKQKVVVKKIRGGLSVRDWRSPSKSRRDEVGVPKRKKK
ncbi:MAG: hypothetical protein Q8N81_03560 [bacterium]|nr:hypothetical protein [bacterium]